MTIRRRLFKESELMKIGPAYRWKTYPSVGQFVALNSGSPALLVLAGGPRCLVSWMDGNSLEHASFDYRVLKPWSEAAP